MINVGYTITGIFIALILIIFCSFFTAKLAQIKGRSRSWGILGFFLNIIGLIIVCFLPSKRDDSKNTNPLVHLSSKIPALSKKTIYIILGMVAAIVITVIAYDNIPSIIENQKYSKQITEQTKSEYEQAQTVETEIDGIFTGAYSTFATDIDGNAYCWGKQHAPHIEDAKDGIIYSNAKEIKSTENLCFILDNGGKLYAIGDTESQLIPQSKKPEPKEDGEETEKAETEFILISENVVSFSISESTVGIIKEDGKLYTYGKNAYGQLGTYNAEDCSEPKAVLGNVEKVCCEATYTVALLQDGQAVAMGSNTYGQFGKEGKSFYSPVVIGTKIKDIATGDDFILLLGENGEVSVCGNNDCGQAANDFAEKPTSFVKIADRIAKIDANKKSAFALSESGELYAWGQNNVGQLGLGNTENAGLPTVAAADVSDLSTSGLHTVIVTTEGKMLATGYNNYRQLGKGKISNSFETLVTVKS